MSIKRNPNPTVTITVSGPTGSGKSRVLAVIADVLKLIHSDCIIDAPDVKAEKEMCGDDHTTWHKPHSGTTFKLEEINQPINTGRYSTHDVEAAIKKLTTAKENLVKAETEIRNKAQAAITSTDLYDRPVPVHIQKLMSKLGVSFEEYQETDLQPVVDLVNWALCTPITPQTSGKTEQSEPIKRDPGTCTHHTCNSRGGLSTNFADRTTPVSLTISDKNRLLASIEARLTEEVKRLADALGRFSRNTQCISHELPDTSHFGKPVTLLLSLGSLQLANALLKNGDKPLLLDDGVEYLRELGLSLNDFIREVELDGRKFLAIALVDNRTDQRLN